MRRIVKQALLAGSMVGSAYLYAGAIGEGVDNYDRATHNFTEEHEEDQRKLKTAPLVQLMGSFGCAYLAYMSAGDLRQETVMKDLTAQIRSYSTELEMHVDALEMKNLIVSEAITDIALKQSIPPPVLVSYHLEESGFQAN